MFKTIHGPITNPKTGESKEISVNFLTSKNAKSAVIGISLILLGTAHLCITMFQNGSKAFEEAELETLDSLGLLD